MLMKIGDIFNDELVGGVPFFTGGRSDTEFEVLSGEEEAAISRVVRSHASLMALTSPTLASILLKQEMAIIKMGGIAKALFPNEKIVKSPGTQNSIVVDIVTPQALFWDTSADATNPCYNGYAANSWDVELTAGSVKYLLGDGTNYYEARSENNKPTPSPSQPGRSHRWRSQPRRPHNSSISTSCPRCRGHESTR